MTLNMTLNINSKEFIFLLIAFKLFVRIDPTGIWV